MIYFDFMKKDLQKNSKVQSRTRNSINIESKKQKAKSSELGSDFCR